MYNIVIKHFCTVLSAHHGKCPSSPFFNWQTWSIFFKALKTHSSKNIKMEIMSLLRWWVGFFFFSYKSFGGNFFKCTVMSLDYFDFFFFFKPYILTLRARKKWYRRSDNEKFLPTPRLVPKENYFVSCSSGRTLIAPHWSLNLFLDLLILDICLNALCLWDFLNSFSLSVQCILF